MSIFLSFGIPSKKNKFTIQTIPRQGISPSFFFPFFVSLFILSSTSTLSFVLLSLSLFFFSLHLSLATSRCVVAYLFIFKCGGTFKNNNNLSSFQSSPFFTLATPLLFSLSSSSSSFFFSSSFCSC